jgi:hypothetical protein
MAKPALTLRDLQYNARIWGPISPEPLVTVKPLIIFDWDDTLQPTSWMVKRNMWPNREYELSDVAEDMFKRLAKTIESLLTYAQELGEVVIITNSDKGWVRECTERFMPSLLPLIHSMGVYSARHLYEERYVDSPHMWKLKAFEKEVSTRFGDYELRNVISIGDSLHERMAVMALKNSSTLTKNIKFLALPEPDVLIYELEFIRHFIDDIVRYGSNLDLMIGLTQSENPVSPVESPRNPANTQILEKV